MTFRFFFGKRNPASFSLQLLVWSVWWLHRLPKSGSLAGPPRRTVIRPKSGRQQNSSECGSEIQAKGWKGDITNSNMGLKCCFEQRSSLEVPSIVITPDALLSSANLRSTAARESIVGLRHSFIIGLIENHIPHCLMNLSQSILRCHLPELERRARENDFVMPTFDTWLKAAESERNPSDVDNKIRRGDFLLTSLQSIS